ncbi:MAG: hypothetical protein IPO32_20715 [Crocinitomicaceae bacterium]|nr:hypothetical protein [Crocinitomicaceae bacterium]
MSTSESEIAQIKREINEANDFVWNLRASPKEGFEPENIISIAYKKALAIEDKFGEGRCLLNMGMGAFILHHDYPLSDSYINQAISIFQNLPNPKWEANALLTQAIIKIQPAILNWLYTWV